MKTNDAAIAIIRDHHIDTTGIEWDPVNGTTVALVERMEGDVLHAYPDPASGGDPWTIGYGHTGPEVVPGLVIDQAQAEALLRADLSRFEQAVDDALDENAVTGDNQFGAMVSLAFNIGAGAFATSHVLSYHNAGNYTAAADSFLLWDHAAGHYVEALYRRRQAERSLYLADLASAG